MAEFLGFFAFRAIAASTLPLPSEAQHARQHAHRGIGCGGIAYWDKNSDSGWGQRPLRLLTRHRSKREKPGARSPHRESPVPPGHGW